MIIVLGKMGGPSWTSRSHLRMRTVLDEQVSSCSSADEDRPGRAGLICEGLVDVSGLQKQNFLRKFWSIARTSVIVFSPLPQQHLLHLLPR